MPHILLVEDDPVLGAGIKMNLEMESYQISWARDLQSARDMNNQNKYDLVVLDLGLPAIRN